MLMEYLFDLLCTDGIYLCWTTTTRLRGRPKLFGFQFHSTGQLDKFISWIILWFLRWQLSWKARSLRCVNIIENSSREHSYLPFFPKYERHFLKRKHLWKPQLKIKISGAHLPTIFNLNHTELLLTIIIKHLILQIFVVTAKCK